MSRSSLKDFETLSRLGAGSFGTVFKVKRYADEQLYVIKNVRIAELSFKEQSEAINEVNILAQLKSPYVVRYYDSFIESESLHIVMEFCNRGDLQNLLKKAKEKNVTGLKESVVWSICLQVILGLHYLHKKHILHRDLKCANVFLTKDPSSPNYLVKIGDLGVAKLMDTSTALASTIVGTPYYLSPELCKDMPYRDKSDCWALGVVFYECCTLQRPFEARNQCALIMKIIEAPVTPPSEATNSQELINLVLWLLQKDPQHRPSTRQILSEETVRSWLSESGLSLPDDLASESTTNYLRERSRNFKAPSIPVTPTDVGTPLTRAETSSPGKHPTAKTPTGPQRAARPAAAVAEDRARIRGDRVRGSNKRVPSERALNRYQRPPVPSSSAQTYDYADGKSSPAAPALRDAVALRRSIKDIPADEKDSFASHQDDGEEGAGDVDSERKAEAEFRISMRLEKDGDADYEDDFEEDEDEDEDEKDIPPPPLLQMPHHAHNATTATTTSNSTGPISFSSHSTVDISHHLAGDDDSEMWASVWTERRGMVGMHSAAPPMSPAVEEPEREVQEAREHAYIEQLDEMIEESRRRLKASLGEELFWKIHDLLNGHMTEDIAEDEADASADSYIVQRLESLFVEHATDMDVACEGVFRLKLLLAMESKRRSLEAPTPSTSNIAFGRK